ncbi:MAG: ABC transporter permease [Myxococcales bacterium]|nr:ABC transporter permease [Myxococcales bacterium]
MPKRFAFAILLLVGLLVGARTYFRWVSPDTAFFTLAALQLIGIILVLVCVFIAASWFTVVAFGIAFRGRLMRVYPLFLGWNLLRSHRRVVRFSHRVAVWTQHVAPLGKPLLLRAIASAGLSAGSLAGAWWVVEQTNPRTLSEQAGQELVVFGLVGIAIVAAVSTIVHIGVGAGLLPRTKLDMDSDLVPTTGRNAITLPNFISMVGVGIGVWAMILVLAVISGFEANLRSKILQTNAHVVIQPEGQLDDIPEISERTRKLSKIEGIASADPHVQQEAMVSSPFNSSVNLTVRGINPGGAVAQRLAENMVAGGLDMIIRPELLGSDRALEWALPQPNSTEPHSPPQPAAVPIRPESPPAEPDLGTPPDNEIEMPPIPGGAPTDDEQIEMPAIPGGAPAQGEKPADALFPGLLLEAEVAKTIEVQNGDLVEVIYSPAPAKGEPENEPRILTLQVVGVYQRSPDDPDRPDGYVLPEVRQRLGATRDRALVILSGPRGADKPGFLGAVSPNSPDVASVSGAMVAGTLEALFDRGYPNQKTPNHNDTDKPRPGYPPPNNVYPGIIIGTELANSLRVGVGHEVRLISLDSGIGPGGVMPKAATFLVAGIFRTGMYEFDLKLAYITVPDAQRFFEMGDSLNRIELRLEHPENPEVLRPQIEAAVGVGTEVLDWQMLNRSLFSALKLEKIVMFLILACIVLVASFNIVSSLAMLIQQKSKEIAILKSMGATDRGILGTFVMLGLFLGFFGAMSGTILGLVTCFVLDQVGIALPREYYVSTIPVKINGFEVLATASAAMLVSIIATILPSLVASRLRPVEGLRYE